MTGSLPQQATVVVVMRRQACLNVGPPLTLVLCLSLAAACGQQKTEHALDLTTTADFASPADLAGASEYVVTATFTGTPRAYTLPDEHSLRYWVAPATVTSLVAQRPDVKTKLRVGMSIEVGTQLLNSADSRVLSNYSDLAKTFPTEEDIPSFGDEIVAFLVHED